MGMMDRDYAHDKRERPFSPPPSRGTGTLKIVLIFLTLLYAFFRLGEWLLEEQASRQAPPRATATATAVQQKAMPLPAPQTPTGYQYAAPAVTENQSVTKCVVNGKTSYGDGPCSAGAVATQVVIRSNHNLMDAVKLPVSTKTDEASTQEVVIAQNNAAPDRSQCPGLKQQIENLDAMARRPQTGQTQDWITAERKKLRDLQFRLGC